MKACADLPSSKVVSSQRLRSGSEISWHGGLSHLNEVEKKRTDELPGFKHASTRGLRMVLLA